MGEVAVTRQAGVSDNFGQMETTGLGDRAMFAPSNMAQALELATLMAASNFVPKHLRGKPGDCVAVVMQAARWGMDPFAVGNKTFFVNDRIAYEAQLVSAVVNSSGLLRGRLQPSWEGQGEDLVCTVTGYIRGDDQPKVRRVEMKSISTRNSPLWKQDPEQQLAYYAQRAWARLHTPEVILGVYTPEEVREMEPIDGGTITSKKVSIADLRTQAAEPADESLAADAAHLAGDLKQPVEEGRADDQHGDQHDGTDAAKPDKAADPTEAITVKLIKWFTMAANDEQFQYALAEFDKAAPDLSDAQYDRVEAASKAASERRAATTE